MTTKTLRALVSTKPEIEAEDIALFLNSNGFRVNLALPSEAYKEVNPGFPQKGNPGKGYDLVLTSDYEGARKLQAKYPKAMLIGLKTEETKDPTKGLAKYVVSTEDGYQGLFQIIDENFELPNMWQRK